MAKKWLFAPIEMEVAEKIFASAINVSLNDSRSYQVIRLMGAPYKINSDKWDESNHQGIGNFDREEKCKRGRGHKILEFNTAGGKFFCCSWRLFVESSLKWAILKVEG